MLGGVWYPPGLSQPETLTKSAKLFLSFPNLEFCNWTKTAFYSTPFFSFWSPCCGEQPCVLWQRVVLLATPHPVQNIHHPPFIQSGNICSHLQSLRQWAFLELWDVQAEGHSLGRAQTSPGSVPRKPSTGKNKNRPAWEPAGGCWAPPSECHPPSHLPTWQKIKKPASMRPPCQNSTTSTRHTRGAAFAASSRSSETVHLTT